MLLDPAFVWRHVGSLALVIGTVAVGKAAIFALVVRVFGYRRVSEDEWGYRVSPDSAVGYVWINELGSSTMHDLRQLERRLQSQGVRALVLDLRLLVGQRPLAHFERLHVLLRRRVLSWFVRVVNSRSDASDRSCQRAAAS